MMRKLTVIWLLLLLGLKVYSQQNGFKTKAFKLLSFSGNINVNGQYNKTFFGEEDGFHYGYQYGVGGFIGTQSYIYHPNFLTLNISAGYQPQFGEVISSLMPDYLTNLSTAQYAINAYFLKNLDHKVNAYLIHDEKRGVDRFYDRDITTNRWGADYKYDGNYRVDSNFEHRDDKELDNFTDRELLTSVTSLRGSVIKSFFKQDRNELNFNLQKTSSESKGLFNNNSNLIYLSYTNRLFLNKKQTIPLNSKLFLSDQSGTFDAKSSGINETITIPIAKQLTFGSMFGHRRLERNSQFTKELRLMGNLSHALYRSLNSDLTVWYNNINQLESYSLANTSIRFKTNYHKKIEFIKGNINIKYEYEFQNQIRESKDSILTIFNEQKLLQDGRITLLNSPNVVIETVVVKDITGTIIYQENIDYILIPRGDNVEIQRLIGGAIANNTVVFIDYDTFENTSYDFNSPGSLLDINLTLFDDLLRLNYINSYRDYKAISGNIDNLGLNEFKRNQYGAHLRYKIFNAGVFYEDYDSTVLPFKLWSYYLSAMGNISRKINYKINGMVNNYVMYFKEGDTNMLTTLSSDIAYTINNSTRLTFNFSYSEQKGDIQDYFLVSGRSEIKKRINQLELSLGVNYYERHVPLQDFASKYLGTYIKIQRNF